MATTAAGGSGFHNPGISTTTTTEATSTSISRGGSSKKTTTAGQPNADRLANKIVAEFTNEDSKKNKYRQFSPYESKKSNWEVVFLPLSVNLDDIKAWNFLYGPALAITLAAFGSKSVWQMQAELLGRPGPGGSDPGGPGDPAGGGDPGGPGGPCCPGEIVDQAAEDYKKTLEAESGRISFSVCIPIRQPYCRE
jgi:hypothetical protein